MWDFTIPLLVLRKSLKATLGNLSGYQPSEAQDSAWVEATGIPFDSFECAGILVDHSVVGPKCSETLAARELAHYPR